MTTLGTPLSASAMGVTLALAHDVDEARARVRAMTETILAGVRLR